MQNPPYARGYVNYLSLLFFLTYGIIMLDASSVTFFADVLMEQLHISTAQYAALNAVVWMAKAVSSIVVGLIANRTGHRKRYLAPLLLIAGVSSMLVVFAGSFFAILILRLLCGLCIGATLSMEMTILAKNISGRDYGLRSGFVSAGSAVIASALGPVLLTGIVMRWSWHSAFLFTGGMTFLMGVLVQCTVREVYFERQPRVDKNRDITVLLHNPVFLCCLLLGIFETAGKMILSTFGPLYLTEIMGLQTQVKGSLLTVMGVVYIPVSLVVPALADRFSPKRVMAVTFALCLLSPLGMLFLEGSGWSVGLYVLFGNWAAATVSIFIYLIPREALPESVLGTANGIIMGASVFFGGCVCPLILGGFAETRAGIRSILIVCCGMFLLCILVSLLLQRWLKGQTDE